MAVDSCDIRFRLALSSWEDQGSVRVCSQEGENLMIFPMSFLKKGEVGTFEFILEQLYLCYDCSEGGLIDGNSKVVASHQEVYAGIFRFTSSIVRAKPGPRGKYRKRPPTESSDSSTMSNSRRSTANQSRFRDELLARDSKCLVTGDHHTGCTACHILPQSRPEYYTEVLNYDPGYLFEARFGLLLRDDIHHAFDRGEIGFYVSGENIVIHIFWPRNALWKDYHGKILQPARFHTTDADRPDTRLLKFHYQQCAMMRFRGFWTESVDKTE